MCIRLCDCVCVRTPPAREAREEEVRQQLRDAREGAARQARRGRRPPVHKIRPPGAGSCFVRRPRSLLAEEQEGTAGRRERRRKRIVGQLACRKCGQWCSERRRGLCSPAVRNATLAPTTSTLVYARAVQLAANTAWAVSWRVVRCRRARRWSMLCDAIAMKKNTKRVPGEEH